MAKVFTSQAVAAIRAKYEACPKETRPPLYWLACDERGRAVRQKIEAWAAAVPTEALQKIRQKLLDADQFRSAYGELLTMHWLGERAFSFDYETRLPNGQTPDLLVHESARGPAFICEVYTEHLSPDMAAKDRKLSELLHRLHAISLDYGLSLRGDHDWHDRDDLDIAQLVQDIRSWLATGPGVGEKRRFGFLQVKVISAGRGYKSVATMGPVITWWVDGHRPWSKIQDKVSRYAAVAKQMQLPLVLAYVTEFAMGTSADTIADALLGDEKVTALIEKESGRIVSERMQRGDDGLFQTPSQALSAVLAVSEINGGIHVARFFNPCALNPLPDDIFEAR